MRKNNRIDLQSLIECICSLAFAIALLFLVLSGKYLSYVTPRMKPYLLFAALVLLFWAYSAIENLYVLRHRSHCLHCFVLVFPLILLTAPRREIPVSKAAAVPQRNVAVMAADASKKSTTKRTGSSSPTPAPTTQPETGESAQEESTPVQEEEAPTPTSPANDDGVYESTDFLGNTTTLHGYDGPNKRIVISDAEFYQWMDVIWADPLAYDGWTLTITGAVDKASREMSADEFIPARLIMTCCAADLTPCGFVCKWNQADTLAPDTWVTITGTVFQRQYDDHAEPQIQVQSVAPAAPVEGYIYPYY